MARDNLFKSSDAMPSFEFNQKVTNVFDDMLNRSVPFYKHILLQISQLIVSPAIIYDLGCSLGGLVPYLKQSQREFNYIGIDKSPDMIAKARYHEASNITFLEGDISQELALDNATAIICNLVLQFIDPKKRTACIQDYFNTLPNGGQLILSKKFRKSRIASHV